MNLSLLWGNHTSYKLLFFTAILILSGSCVTQRQVEYLQKEKKNSQEEYINNSYSDYLLKPNDELYIQITSLDDAAATIFASSANQNLGNLNAYGASLMSHTIDNEGYLELPVIGKIAAKGKTTEQLKSMIKDALTNILNQPVVSVKLVNRYISVLGEVRNPGHFVYSIDKLSLFNAIGMAGDITEYGNRKNILLIRNEGNVNIKKQLSLLNSDILSSDFYFLKPGDIIYVKPLRNKFWGLRQFPFTLVFSSITTAILVLSYVE